LPAGGAGVAFVHAAQVKGGAAEGPSGVDSATSTRELEQKDIQDHRNEYTRKKTKQRGLYRQHSIKRKEKGKLVMSQQGEKLKAHG
jgi:hypothetical protein